MLRKLIDFVTPRRYRRLPRTEYGTTECSARFGVSWIVVITWNTDTDGDWVEFEDYSNQTFHGPFYSVEEAEQWVVDFPEDKDLKDYEIAHINNVR